MISFPIIRVITKLIIPYILLFGMYVQFHGDFGPGGGFPGGGNFRGGINSVRTRIRIAGRQKSCSAVGDRKLISVGLLLYAGTGVTCMMLGGNFLDYDVLDHHFLHEIPEWMHFLPGDNRHFIPSGQHLGIFVVELGVGITVTAVMDHDLLRVCGARTGSRTARGNEAMTLDQAMGLFNYWIVIFLMMTGFTS